MSLSPNNEHKLTELIWEIKASQGEFRLILLRCNYLALQSQILQRLEQLGDIKIVHLQAGDTSLYRRLQTELGQAQTDAVVILGFEVLENVAEFLRNANLNRDRLAQEFPLPLIFCIDEEIYGELLRFAGDLESWGSSVDFCLTTEELLVTIRAGIEAVFAGVLVGEEVTDCPSCREILVASQELLNQGEELEVELQRDLAFLRGQDFFTQGRYDEALAAYHQGLTMLGDNDDKSKLAAFSLQIGFCHFQKGEQATETEEIHHWQQARDIWQQTLASFQGKRQDAKGKSINLPYLPTSPSPYLPTSLQLAEVLHRLEAWQALAGLLPSLQAQQPPEIRAQIAGFRALLALSKQRGEVAQVAANQALDLIAQVPLERQQQRSFYLLLLARAKQELADCQGAFSRQTEAVQLVATDHPKPYLKLLRQLQRHYFDKKEYRLAFLTKLQRRSLEQQYGFRAFIGAGTIANQVVGKKALTASGKREAIAQEIIAFGREEDVKNLAARVGDREHKLTIIYGESGVGKSSLVSGGLVPLLKSKPLGSQDALVMVLRVYTNWLLELGQLCTKALAAKGIVPPTPLTTQEAIIQQLRQCETANLRPVLIFDQFEEFFFLPTTPREKEQFFRFVGSCLEIIPLKVVYSMRKDYLDQMLEQPGLETIAEDILSKNVLYRVGNLAAATVPGIIRSLTERANFPLSPDLVTRLVEDLAGEQATIRPIELQIVGAQLQAEKITTLPQYEARGTKEALVEGYLQAVVADCGPENEQLAELLLLLLTDEKGTRPLKTRGELATELEALGQDLGRLDLVLEIVVKSGLVLLIPEQPEERYQLVHDYLAEFIQQQQQPQLARLQEEFAREREQRLLTQEELAKAEAAKETAIKQTARRIKVGVGVLAMTLLSSAAVLAFAGMRVTEADQRVVKAEKTEQEASKEVKEAEAKISQAEEREAAANQNLKQTEAKVTKVEQEANKARKNLQAAQREKQQADKALTTARQRREAAEAKEQEARQEYAAAQANLEQAKEEQTKAEEKSREADQNLQLAQQRLNQAQSNLVAAEEKEREAQRKADEAERERIFAEAQTQVAEEKLRDAEKQQEEAIAGTKLERAGVAALKKFERQQLSALLAAMKAGRELQEIVEDGRTLAEYPAASPMLALQTIVLNIREKNKLEHQGFVNSVEFSPDGERIVTASSDGTAKVWNKQGQLLHTLEGHQGGVNSAEFSPDGERIVTTSYDHTAKVWDKQGQLLHTLEGHQDGIWSAEFSPNGERILTASADGTAKVWGKQGQLLHTLEGHQDWVTSAEFSSDGERIVTASRDSTAKVWNKQGQLLHTLEEHQDAVYSAEFSPDGERIVTASRNSPAKVWDKQGQLLHTLEEHQDEFFSAEFSPDGERDEVFSAEFSPDGERIVTASGDGTAKVWDKQGQLLHTLEGHQRLVRSAEFSLDGERIVTASADGTAKVWDKQGQLIYSLSGHQDAVYSAEFSLDGERIITASFEGPAKVWDKQGQLIYSLSGHQDAVYSAEFSPDGEHIVTASGDRTAKVWDKQGQLIYSLSGHQDAVYSAEFSPDGERIVTASGDGTAKIWNKQGQLLHTLEGHQDAVYSAEFSLDGERIVTASRDGTAKVWNKQGQLLHTLEGHQGEFISAEFSPDGERIVTASGNGTAKVWDKQGQLLYTLERYQGELISVEFSPDGERIVTASRDGTAKVWNKQGQLLHTLEGHQDAVYSAEFSPDGEHIVTASFDGTAKIWDKQGQLLHILEGHQNIVISVEFSPDGERIVTASGDDTAKVWDKQGREIANFDKHKDAVYSAKFSPDGERIVTASYDGTAKVWPVDNLDELLDRGCNWLKAYLTNYPERNVWEGGKLCPGISNEV